MTDRADPRWWTRTRHLALGGALALAVVLGVATLSAAPSWQGLPEGDALVRLSFTHSGVRNCRPRTEAELAALPRNMRAPEICDRRRAPVRVEMRVDGALLLAADLAPSGLAGSGPSRIYHGVALPAGPHRIEVGLQDDPAAPGFAHEARFDIAPAPGASVAIDFDAAARGFFLR